MKMSAIIGSGQPIARRVASSSSTTSTEPIADVERQRIADAEREVVEDPRDVEDRHGDRDRQDPVDERHAAGRSATPTGRALLEHRLAQREDEEDEPEHEREVDAAMRRLAQQAEAGRVVVEARQDDQQRRRRSASPAARSGRNRISGSNFSSSSQRLGECRFPACHGSRAARRSRSMKRGRVRPAPLRASSVASRPTSAGPFPCRTSRRPDGTGCRRRPSRWPCWIALPLAWPASSSLRVLSFHIALVIS